MAWRPHVVRQGDYLVKLAQMLGFDADQVWNHPSNAELASRRRPDVLAPGDILYVPERKHQWMPLEMGATNHYAARVPLVPICLMAKTREGPLANEQYEVNGLDRPTTGKTEGDGKLVVRVRPWVREFSVLFPRLDIVQQVRVGEMDPVDEPSGIRKRLEHLGHYAAHPLEGAGVPIADDSEARIRAAIVSFQKAARLPATGIADSETRAALIKEHGS